MLRRIPPPGPARAVDAESWDVIVVGGGGAGLAAAISAAERGVSVLLLERGERLGGSTAMSIGSLTAAGTRWQRRRGIVDTTDALLQDMALAAGVDPKRDAPELRAMLAADAAPALEWLSGLGVPFVGPFPEVPHRVPRMHNVIPSSLMYIACLERAARKKGVSIALSAPVRGLVEEEGRVSAVDALVDGRPRRLTARRGVILATGDFSGNRDMRAAYLPPAAANSVAANEESTGDGQRLALALGAALRSMDISTGPKLRFRSAPARGLLSRLPLWPWLMRPLAGVVQVLPNIVLRPFVKSLLVVHMQPSPKLFERGAILVNLRGERFCDETKSTLPLAHQPEAAGYVVFDETIAGEFNRYPNFVSTAPGVGYAFMRDYERARPELVHRGTDSAALARRLDFDPARFAEALRGSRLTESDGLVALGPALSTLTVTEGGVSVDALCRVLRPDGSAIAGLYGAGGVAQGGMRLSGHGFHIAWAIVSGRVAGHAAARLLPKDDPVWGNLERAIGIEPTTFSLGS